MPDTPMQDSKSITLSNDQFHISNVIPSLMSPTDETFKPKNRFEEDYIKLQTLGKG
jgi:hypothetical protein